MRQAAPISGPMSARISQPWEKIAKAYGAVHGGVPQAREANLTAHLRRVQGVFSGRVSADFEGVCNIDFEGWQTNVWENIYCDAKNSNATNWRLYTHGYQMYSKLLVLRDHPDWDDARVTAEAKRQFEAAATTWLVRTLEAVKAAHQSACGGTSRR